MQRARERYWYIKFCIKEWPGKRREAFWLWLVRRRCLVSLRYWACIKAAVDAAGRYRSPADVTAIEMLKATPYRPPVVKM